MTIAYDLMGGNDVKAYLSRGLKKRNAKDELLWDWDVHHLHLGDHVEDDGFVVRSGPLLFALVREHAVFLIDIRPHGAWADDELVEIMHTNWRSEIARFRIPLSPGKRLKPEERHQLRKAGVTPLFHTQDGTVYGMIGGGITTSRDSAWNAFDGGRLLKEALHVESFLREQVDWLSDLVAQNIGHVPNEVRVQLVELRADRADADVLVRNDVQDFGLRIPIESPQSA